MIIHLFLFLFDILFVLNNNEYVVGNSVPVLTIDPKMRILSNKTTRDLKYLPFIMLIDKNKDTSEYWRETEILSLVRSNEMGVDYEQCEKASPASAIVQFPSRRTVRPICRGRIDRQLCPQCSHFNNRTECELFRDSCKERKVLPSELRTYCDRKYGKWRTMFLPADYTCCRCCDECIFYRELDQSCMADEYTFDAEEFLPVTSIDFRAGCNPYWGHPEQEFRALRCDKILRRCVPVSVPSLPNETLNIRRSYRYEPTTGGQECPVSCRGYDCFGGLVREQQCAPGAFLPDKEQCNCCGRCSVYQQINQKCAEFKKTVHNVNGTKEIEVEEEFLEPGCDDGLVCRQGRCQDIHTIQTSVGSRRKRDETLAVANEPCKRELKYFKKKYGVDGHLHYDAPQCTPLWLYAPVQCRRFVCYCSLEDGSFIQGIKVPRVEVSNMNCDCAREKCRTSSDVECDGYGNYKQAVFTPHIDEWGDVSDIDDGVPVSVPSLPNETLNIRRSYRYEPTTGGQECPVSCRGYDCFGGLVREQQCAPGAFLPDKEQCNCCGRCSVYQQINQKCAEFKKTVHNVNGTKEIEVEEEFLEPGCDDGLVCRQGRCQDIHTIQTSVGSRRKRDETLAVANEPCKRELKYFKKKYGVDGHLHYDAPQCTPLWLYAPVQCRRFVCYCSLEDGSFIQGIKVPRVEVSNMNCDCAREKCRTSSDVECDGYGNYKQAVFTPHIDEWGDVSDIDDGNHLAGHLPHRAEHDVIELSTAIA